MYTWIVLKSGHLIKVESTVKISFDYKNWSNCFAGELYDSTGKILIASSNEMNFRREDAICYT